MRARLVLALLGVAASAACASGDLSEQGSSAPLASPAATRAVPSPSPSPSPRPVPVPLSPLTGQPTPAAAAAPVVVVKVDNGVLARPYHRGLAEAAVVYQELVEGGATRFAAVFDRTGSQEVGPVRSARVSDFELLRPLGPVALAFSGANAGTLREFGAEVRAGRALDASYDAVPQIYRLAERRADARNFFTTPDGIRGARPTSASARDIGLRFGPPGASGAPAGRADIRFSQFSLVTATYDPGSGTYRLRQDGRPMPGVQPSNVIIQRVRIRPTQYRDVLGLPTPYTVTVGSGAATVLRDGRRTDGRWERPTPSAGTRFLQEGGDDIRLRPGPTWVMLVPDGQPLMTS
jgi:hypothetical protein